LSADTPLRSWHRRPSRAFYDIRLRASARTDPFSDRRLQPDCSPTPDIHRTLGRPLCMGAPRHWEILRSHVGKQVHPIPRSVQPDLQPNVVVLGGRGRCPTPQRPAEFLTGHDVGALDGTDRSALSGSRALPFRRRPSASRASAVSSLIAWRLVCR